MAQSIVQVEHPEYKDLIQNWIKWRLAYVGGDIFINQYLTKFSARESDDDFKTRKCITYCPAFAKAAINDIKNAIYQRTADVTRAGGGSESYHRAIEGLDNGVDLLGSDMNSFIGRKLLPELLVMGKVGVYVDMPSLSENANRAEAVKKHPYLYFYQAEDIPCWDYDESSQPYEFQTLLLRDWVYLYQEGSDLPYEKACRFRHLWREDGVVYVQFYDDAGTPCSATGSVSEDVGPTVLDIPTIPFIILNISSSLMSDVANYQVAHLNMASADVAYTLKSNFPFYVEAYDPRTELVYTRPEGDGTSAGDVAANKDIKVGVAQGRRYPLGVDAPSFIHPSAEPLTASMAKQEVLKAEIRQLVNLAVTSLQPKMASAESKNFDERSLEAGLSYIGLELEQAERLIGRYWAMYEHTDEPTINYPKNYSLKTEADRRAEAKELQAQMETVPSMTYKRNMAKQIVHLTLGDKVSVGELEAIYREIDKAPAIIGSADTLAIDVANGLVSLDTASKVRGYPDGEAAKANADHAARLARISAAQAAPDNNNAARGNADLSGAPAQDAAAEKAASRDTTTKDSTASTTRGKGK